MEPINSANIIFGESRKSLMAHTIRGVINYFWKEAQVELDVRVKPDHFGIIELRAPKDGTTCVLMTSFIPALDHTQRSRLKAIIFIHKDANQHLARVCIAHEIYHLLMELDAYVKTEFTKWISDLPTSKLIEDECNHFAWELCRQHDLFNQNDAERKKTVLFPPHTFDQPFNMNNSIEWFTKWPDGFALDSTKAFWKQ